MDGMYDVGGIEAHLGATFDDRKFNEWERELDKAEARARRERIEAQLGAKLDDSAFAAFERHLDKAEARAKRRDAFKAALGVDYDAKASQALRAYERDLDRAEHEQQRLARSAVSMHRDVGNARGFMAASSAVSALNRNVAGLRNTVSLLKWPAAITGVGLFAQTLSTAAAGATALVSGLAPLGGLLAALPAAASAGLQSVGAVGLATLGVTDAITAAFEDQKTSSSGVTSALERQESATESIRDAELRLADAQRQTRYAEQERTAAVREARQELLDLRAAVEGNALSEEQAALALRQARQEYARVASDPGSSMLDIEQAELGVRQARFDLDQATREAARTERDFAEARERGVRRMPQVVAATRALRDARRAEREAALDVRRAYDDAGDAADNLAAKSAASASKAEQALQKLPPAARAFAREIIDLKPRIDALRADTAEGFFPGAEQGLHRSLGLLDVLERRLPRTAGVIGGLVAQAGAWAGSRDVLADVETQMRRNDRWVRQLGEGTLDLADATRNVTLEAGPLVGWLVKSTREIAALVQQESEAARETGELKAIFRETREVTSDVAHIAWDIAAGLWEIGKAGKPLGDEILDDLRDGAAEFREWTESAEGRNELKEYFDDARPAVRELGRLTEEAVKMFFRLGRGDQVAPLLEKIRTELLPVVEEVVDNTTEAFGPALIDTLVEVLELFGTMVSEGGPLVEAVELVGAIAGKINDLIDRFPALGDAVGTIVALGGLAKALQIAGAITGMTRLIGLMRTARGIAATTGAMEVAAGAGAARAGAGAAAGAAAGRGAMLGPAGWIAAGTGVLVLGGLEANRRWIRNVNGVPLAAGTDDRTHLRTSASDLGKAWGVIARGPRDLGSLFDSPTGLWDRLFPDDAFKKINEFGDRIHELGDGIKKLPAHELGALGREARSLANEADRLGDKEAAKALREFADATNVMADDAERNAEKAKAAIAALRAGIKGKDGRPLSADDILDPYAVRVFTSRIDSMRTNGVRSIDDLRARMQGQVEEIERGFKKGSQGAARAMALNFETGFKALRKAMRAGVIDTDDGMKEIRRITRQQMQFARDHMDELSGEGRDALAANFRAAARAVREQMRNGEISTRDGLREIRKLMREALMVYGLSEQEARDHLRGVDPTRGTTYGGGGNEGGAQRNDTYKARGGWIGQPGEAGGDDVFTAMPADWAILNRHQQAPIDAMLGPGFLDRLVGGASFLARGGVPGGAPVVVGRGELALDPDQQGVIEQLLGHGFLGRLFDTVQTPHYLARGGLAGGAQRFAYGGMVAVPGQGGNGTPPGVEYVNRSIAPLVRSLIGRYHALITDGFDPTGTKHESAGHLRTGTAVDFVPGPGGSWDEIDSLAAWAVRAGYHVLYDGRFGTIPYADHGRGNHLHIDFGAGGSPAVPVPRLVEKLKRVKVRGDLGVVSRVAQGAVDMGRAAAQARLERIAGSLFGASADVGGTTYTGPLDRVFPMHYLGQPGVQLSHGQVARLVDATTGLPQVTKDAFKRYIIDRESARHPGIIGRDPGGTLGYGLTQVTTEVNGAPFERVVQALGGWRQMLNPVKNLQAAAWLANHHPGGPLGPWSATAAIGGFVRRLLARLPRAASGKRGRPTPTGPKTGTPQPTRASLPPRILPSSGIAFIEGRLGLSKINPLGFPAFEKALDKLDAEYARRDREFDLTEEEFLIEQDDGSAVLDMEAVNRRAHELDELVKIREQIAAKLRAYREAVLAAIARYRSAITWLSGALKTATAQGRVPKERNAYRSRISAYEARIGELQELLDGPNGIAGRMEDTRLDIAELDLERRQIPTQEGVARSNAQLAHEQERTERERYLEELDLERLDRLDLDARPPSALEIAEAAAQQLRSFQSGLDELFGSFGQNFVRSGADPFAGDLARMAGMRHFGGASGADPLSDLGVIDAAGGVPASALAGAAGGGRVTIVQGPLMQVERMEPEDAHPTTQAIHHEIEAL